MDTLMTAIFIGIISLGVWKTLIILFKYKELCSNLKKNPQKPSHWLQGHGKEVKDSITYNNYVMDIIKGGGRMYCIWNGPFPALGVCHPETFQQLNKQAPNKARGLTDWYRIMEPWIGEGLTISGGKKWERNRRLLNPAFHFDILSGYVDVMNDVTDSLLDKLEEASQKSGSVDTFPYSCRAALDTMLRCLLSYEGSMLESNEHEYIKAVQRLTMISWERMMQPLLLFDFLFNLSPLGREHNRLIEVVHKFTGDIIEARRSLMKEQPDTTKQKERLDFLDILLTAKDEKGQGLTQQEIQDEVDNIAFAGHDTSGSSISWAIYALGQNLDIQEKVYKDVLTVTKGNTHITQNHLSQFRYLPLFIKEVLRFYSLVPIVARKHSEPITIDGIEIPPGPRVDINIYAIHHNPEVWKNPDEFNPDRFDIEQRSETDIYGFIPFSTGSRNCIGQVFAMNEIKIALAKFVNRFEALPVKDHKPQFLPSTVLRSLNGLPVMLRRRQQ
ncbi:cytochrome P450 4A2-like isoform X3 [Mercenaria mercenaria]|uniref:cytochrome P450 4A2-like isoform X3 n=2 Tax=Mercenaria mercenaria TaxID=6596 RepID=UPI00234F89E6|nr:cytochrome P450 4A2-like isoform X3 [Mercenaria mercenaria]